MTNPWIALSPGGIENGTHVVHPIVHRAGLDSVGEAHASLVEEDQPGECRQPLAEHAVSAVIPVDVEVRDVALDEDQVARPIADHPVGNVDVAIARIPDGTAHGASVADTGSSVKAGNWDRIACCSRAPGAVRARQVPQQRAPVPALANRVRVHARDRGTRLRRTR